MYVYIYTHTHIYTHTDTHTWYHWASILTMFSENMFSEPRMAGGEELPSKFMNFITPELPYIYIYIYIYIYTHTHIHTYV
jgi:hypothetical protein